MIKIDMLKKTKKLNDIFIPLNFEKTLISELEYCGVCLDRFEGWRDMDDEWLEELKAEYPRQYKKALDMRLDRTAIDMDKLRKDLIEFYSHEGMAEEEIDFNQEVYRITMNYTRESMHKFIGQFHGDTIDADWAKEREEVKKEAEAEFEKEFIYHGEIDYWHKQDIIENKIAYKMAIKAETRNKEEKAMKNTKKKKVTVVNTYENPIEKRYLARNVLVDNNTFITGINNNDLIIGPSGAGKTRGYIIPNLLHTDENLIIADTKGNLYRLYGDYLKKKGYKVKCIDFTDIDHTPCGYNPLDYIRTTDVPDLIQRGDRYSEQDVKKIAATVCPIQSEKDSFWDMAARMYLEMLILYVLNTYPPEARNLCEVYKMLCQMGSKEFKLIFDEEEDTHPDSAITKKYRMISNNANAEKMHASIIGILAQHLDAVSYSNTERMFTMKNRIDLSSFVNEKTVLFLNVSDNDRSQDTIVNCFYTQAFQYLIAAAAKRKDSRLPIPVRFLLDDFSTNTVIPDFDNLTSVIRSREISVSLVVQSISQLEGLYGRSKAITIINNCDHCLYIGGTDVETAQYFAQKFNCQVSTVLNLPLNSAFLFERGKAPFKVEKYDLEADEIYAELKKKQGGGFEGESPNEDGAYSF